MHKSILAFLLFHLLSYGSSMNKLVALVKQEHKFEIKYEISGNAEKNPKNYIFGNKTQWREQNKSSEVDFVANALASAQGPDQAELNAQGRRVCENAFAYRSDNLYRCDLINIAQQAENTQIITYNVSCACYFTPENRRQADRTLFTQWFKASRTWK